MVTRLGARKFVSGLARCCDRKVKYSLILKTYECLSEETGRYMRSSRSSNGTTGSEEVF